MRRTRFNDWPCSVARAVDILGDWWTPLVLRDAFYGLRRFDDLQASLGIGRNVLAERLRRLVDEGILERKMYERHPPRFEYRLTEMGRDLSGVICALMRWGDDWLADKKGPPVELVDRETGRRVKPVIVDEETGEPIDMRRIRAQPGPGFPKRLLKNPAVARLFPSARRTGTDTSGSSGR